MSGRKGSAGEVLAGFSEAAFVALMNLIFLPYQALVCLDAIIRALVRGFITGERLLEWETAAQAEVHRNGHTLIDRYFALTPLVSSCGGGRCLPLQPAPSSCARGCRANPAAMGICSNRRWVAECSSKRTA